MREKILFFIFSLVLFLPLNVCSEEIEEDESLSTNVLIIFDSSGSMRGRRLTEAKESVRHFLESLGARVNLGLLAFTPKGEPLEVEKIQFSDQVTGEERSSILQRIKSKLKSIVAMGPTPLTKCLEKCLKICQARLEDYPYERNVVLMVTDGKDTVSGTNTVAPIMDKLTKTGVSVNLIAFETKNNEYLKKYASKYFQPNNRAELQEALKEAMTEAETFSSYGE
ncbi:VWA domain-containing protein [Candidatus Riflebacteria bacterium]